MWGQVWLALLCWDEQWDSWGSRGWAEASGEAEQRLRFHAALGSVRPDEDLRVLTGIPKDSLGWPTWVAHHPACLEEKEHWLRLQYLRTSERMTLVIGRQKWGRAPRMNFGVGGSLLVMPSLCLTVIFIAGYCGLAESSWPNVRRLEF